MLKLYRVILREYHAFTIAFECMAEDDDHAKEQAENAYPDCQVVRLFVI
jgi:hypothetical protein